MARFLSLFARERVCSGATNLISMQFAIFGEHIELSQLLKAARLVETGGSAKLSVKNGWAKLNGEICTMCAKKVRPGDKVEFDGKVIEIIAK